MVPHENECWSAVAVETHELCNDEPPVNTNYTFKPYSWSFCCDKMKQEMGDSVKFSQWGCYVYMDFVDGYDSSTDIIINNCPFCGKPIVLEQTKRLEHWKKIVYERYSLDSNGMDRD